MWQGDELKSYLVTRLGPCAWFAELPKSGDVAGSRETFNLADTQTSVVTSSFIGPVLRNRSFSLNPCRF